jgi:extracellular factor (EF) 3-hydroxypalmitic acid methyl ester biosynthesis protein
MLHSALEMNKTPGGNGNGEGANGLLEQPKKRAAPPSAATTATEAGESRVTFQTHDKLSLQGTPERITRHQAVFELHSPAAVPRLSEALDQFQIVLQGRTVYSGRAVVRSVVDAGPKIVCAATLNDAHWTDLNLVLALQQDGQIEREFKSFLVGWQKSYRVLPEFKIVVADMQTFLQDMQLWLERVELGISALPSSEQAEMEHEIARQLAPEVVPVIANLFEKFEAASSHIDEDLIPAHHAFGKLQLQPFLMCSPFVWRTLTKPLGYAGDYEMVNMMLRDPLEGGSLFGKMINAYALQLPPIVAHRNRLAYLREQLVKETLRVTARGDTARVFNLGCGPAQEVQRFLAEDAVSNRAHFTLADFNQETLEHTAKVLADLKRRHTRRTTILMQKQNVTQLIKAADRPVHRSPNDLYDVVYCAGVFDYLSDQVCQRLMDAFYDLLAPDGLLIVTNVDKHPARHEMECFLEWNLIYRDANQMRTIVPRRAAPENVLVRCDATGVNLFLEVRKPAHEK